MSGRRFWLLHGVLPALLFLPLALVFEYTPVDAWVADQLHDPLRHVWIGDGSWWAKGLIHEGGRQLVALLGLSGLALWGLAQRIERLRAWGRPGLFVGLGVLACTSLVALLKHYSNVDCPEDLVRYGGDRLYVHLFADKPDGAPRGGCFPGGHSSGAFSLMTIYFLLRERGSAWTRRGLLAVLALGSLFALGQWARGEHFLSHDAWSAIICWYVILLIHTAVFQGHVWATPLTEAVAGKDLLPGATPGMDPALSRADI